VVLLGMHARFVDVEVHLGGMPGFTLVGLADAAVNEARDRVRAAVLSSGEPWPQQRITANLSPASVPKHGTHFDLPLAAAVLAATGAVPAGPLAELVVLGELGLDGRVRPVRGVLPAVLGAAQAGAQRFVVPLANLAEAQVVPDVDVLGVSSLRSLLAQWRAGLVIPPAAGRIRPIHAADRPTSRESPDAGDLVDVVGQPVARRLVEIAAAGGHHLLLSGPPGSGKTMLARRMPGLLPALDPASAIEVSAVRSLLGLLDPDAPVLLDPPFVEPHHTCSAAALVGGGSGIAQPGAVSLAHHGLLLLDEAPEFNRTALEALRQPLETGEVVITRSRGSGRFPARFQLVMTANPCPCGYSGSVQRACACPPDSVRRYRNRLSGPLLDRVDLLGRVGPVSRAALAADAGGCETSEVVRERVAAARERQARRFAGLPWRTNADIPVRPLRSTFRPEASVVRAIVTAVDRGVLSARGADRVLRVAWTIADLAGAAFPLRPHVEEALAHNVGAGNQVVA
jgi:magnesium chelatase family protein